MVSQKHGHINWQAKNIFIFSDILCINQISFPCLRRKFVLKSIQRSVRFIAGGLYFYGANFVLSCQQKINFIIMVRGLFGKGIIEQFVSRCFQHLLRSRWRSGIGTHFCLTPQGWNQIAFRLFYKRRFSNSSCAFDQKSGLSIKFFFPSKHFLIKFSFEYHLLAPSFCFIFTFCRKSPNLFLPICRKSPILFAIICRKSPFYNYNLRLPSFVVRKIPCTVIVF